MVNEKLCKKCGSSVSAATGLNALKPTEGSISICWNCANIAIFEEDLNLRDIKESELQIVKERDPEAYGLLIASLEIIKKRGPIK